MRSENGLLIDVTAQASIHTIAPSQIKDLLQDAIARAAEQGKPYTKTGVNALYKRAMSWGNRSISPAGTSSKTRPKNC